MNGAKDNTGIANNSTTGWKNSGENTPSVTAKFHNKGNILLASIDIYGTRKMTEGTGNTEITKDGITKIKETEATTSLGIFKFTTNVDGSGGSFGVGTDFGIISLGGQAGGLVTLDYSARIPFTQYGYGVTATFNPIDMVVVPVRATNPELNLIYLLAR